MLNASTVYIIDLNGRWIYNLSSSNNNTNEILRNEAECIRFRHDDSLRDWIAEHRLKSYACPCSEKQMQYDLSYRIVDPMYKFSKPLPTCYEAWFFNNDGVKQTCCYRLLNYISEDYFIINPSHVKFLIME